MKLELRDAQVLYAKLCRDSADTRTLVRMFRMKLCFHNSYLYALCRRLEPEIVIETGVNAGVSTSFILQALRDNRKGHLYSIDLPIGNYRRDDGRIHTDRRTRGTETGFYVPIELRDRWTLIFGDARKELPYLTGNLETIDIFHHDSLHTYDHMYFEYETAWRKLRIGGLLTSDDVTWSNAFFDFCRSKNVTGYLVQGAGFAFKDKLY